MAKKYVSQEVYDAMKGITSDKNEFEYLTSVGATADAEKYREAAKPKYDVLNAYSPELAKAFTDSNSVKAKDILAQYGVKSTRQPLDILNDIYGYKVGYEGLEAKGDAGYQQKHNDALAYYDELESIDPSLSAMASGMNAQQLKNYIMEKTPTQPLTVSETFNDVHKKVGDYGTTFQDNMQKMYFDESYGQGVRDNFNRYGTMKGNQAAANSASDNGGNFDSFSEYNKNLTDMSYRIAGENAIQKMREGYAGDATNFLNVWGNQLAGNANNFADYDYNMEKVKADERIANAGYDVDRYNIDKNYGLGVYQADKNYDLGIYNSDTQRYLSDNELAATGVKASTNKGTTKGTSDEPPEIKPIIDEGNPKNIPGTKEYNWEDIQNDIDASVSSGMPLETAVLSWLAELNKNGQTELYDKVIKTYNVEIEK